MYKAYVKKDTSGNIIGYSTDLSVNLDGTFAEVIQDDPVIDISKLLGYKLAPDDETAEYHLIFDENKWKQKCEETAREQAVEKGKKMLTELSTKTILDSASDEDAYVMRYMYESWAPKTDYEVGDRRRYGDNLYKCKQAHTSEEGPNRTPDYLPALWDLIAPEDPTLGTIDNPIKIPEPFSSMIYVKGKYYLEGDTLYLMNRDGMEDGEEISLTHKPSELIGQYFEVVE